MTDRTPPNTGSAARRRHLIIFARFPIAGGGKRRLAKGVGAAHAVRFQRVRVRHLTARLAHDPRWTTWIAATPDFSGPWVGGLAVFFQGRGDLGQRMTRMAKAVPAGDIVMIGSDIPGIRPDDIACAFASLGGHRAVFGPASDGGYWLVGLKGTPARKLPFDRVRWSSAHTLADTIANVTAASTGPVAIARLRTLDDIDEPADLAADPDWARLIRPR